MGDGDRPYLPYGFGTWGEDGAFDPLKEERREDGSLPTTEAGAEELLADGTTDGGGNMKAPAAVEGVLATDVVGVGGAATSLVGPKMSASLSLSASLMAELDSHLSMGGRGELPCLVLEPL